MPNCRGAHAPQGVQPEAHGGRPALPAGSAHSNAPSLSPHFAAGGPITAFLLYRQNFNIFLQRLQGKSAGDLTIFLRYIIIISKKAALRQMGERKMADISVMDAERLCGWLPRRVRETHKGDFGRILLLCGAVGYTGAPALAAMGAARTSAGRTAAAIRALLRAGAATCWRAFSSHCWGRACRPCMQRLRLRGSTERRPTAAPPGWGSTACCPRTLRRSCHIYCHRRGCACGEAAPY